MTCVCLSTASWEPGEACQQPLCCFSQSPARPLICEPWLSQTQLLGLGFPIPCVPNFAILTVRLVSTVTPGNPGKAKPVGFGKKGAGQSLASGSWSDGWLDAKPLDPGTAFSPCAFALLESPALSPVASVSACLPVYV